MKDQTTYCKYDTHKKEILCPYYENGHKDKLGCKCKFMKADHCYNLEYIGRKEADNA